MLRERRDLAGMIHARVSKTPISSDSPTRAKSSAAHRRDCSNYLPVFTTRKRSAEHGGGEILSSLVLPLLPVIPLMTFSRQCCGDRRRRFFEKRAERVRRLGSTRNLESGILGKFSQQRRPRSHRAAIATAWPTNLWRVEISHRATLRIASPRAISARESVPTMPVISAAEASPPASNSPLDSNCTMV